MMSTFTVQVDYTDRSRDGSGRFVTTQHVVGVQARGPIDATLLAAQFVVATQCAQDGMVTATRIVE